MALQVGPYNPHDPNDEIERKLYYQWVPFVLFLQGVMFYVPHLIFKAFEGKKLDSIIAGLNNWVMSNSERKGKEEELATYIRETKVSLWCFFWFLYLDFVVDWKTGFFCAWKGIPIPSSISQFFGGIQALSFISDIFF